MADAVKSQTLDKFLGINNVDDPTRLSPIVVGHEYVHPLQQASNVEIDNTYGLSSRSGYDDVLSGSDIHSLWSDGDSCLYVDGNTLYKLNTDYTNVSLHTKLTSAARMSYTPFNDRIYCTNKHEIGYVKDQTFNQLSDPEISFKSPLPPGQLIEYYRGCLYVARDNTLYISDPLCDYFDIRSGFKLFTSNITLLRAVDDGLYVGDSKIWWVQGQFAEDFDRKEVYPSPAIIHTSTLISGQHVGDGIKGKVAIWTSENGICMGDNSGSVSNLTESRYTFTPSAQGTGFIREKSNIRHYINSLY